MTTGKRPISPFLPAGILAAVLALRLAVQPFGSQELQRPLADFEPTIGGFELARDLEVQEDEEIALRADELLYREYENAEGRSISLYVAYYGRQSGEQSIHSPSNCLPASGWELIERDRVKTRDGDRVVEVNRTLIEHQSGSRALVYYWYQGRGKVTAGEYEVKLQLFRDALFDRRTDEGLVRVVFPVAGRGDDLKSADALASATVPRVIRSLSDHLPG